MQRKDFLKQGFTLLGFATIAPFVAACSKDGASGCGTTTPSETAGPFPTKRNTEKLLKELEKCD